MQCVKEEKKEQVSTKKERIAIPVIGINIPFRFPCPGTYIQPVSPPLQKGRPVSHLKKKKYIKKKTRPQFGGSDASETCVCQCLKLQGACAKKKTIEMDHVWATWPTPTPVSCVVDAASLEHRRSSISWSDVRKTGYVAHLLVAAKR